MKHSCFTRRRDSPAIPHPEDLVFRNCFVLHECVTAFEDRDHDLMRPSRGHFFKSALSSQLSLFEEG